MKRIFPIISLLLLVYLTGCVTLDTITSNMTDQPRVVQAPPMYQLGQEDTPIDIKLVTAAIIYKLRGVDGAVEHVSFDPDGFIQIGEEDFHYEGFEMTKMTITGYQETVIQAKKKTMVTLEGVLLFKDEINRRAGVYFAANYSATKKGIVIENAFTNGIPPDSPQIEAFLVPADVIKPPRPDVENGYLPLYLLAVQNAIPMTAPVDQKPIYPKGEYLMMVFCKDRIFKESIMEMKVSALKSLRGKSISDVAYIAENGWRIMVSGGKFAPGSTANRFYYGVEYTANPGADTEPVKLALFSNRIQTDDPNQPAPATNSMQQPAQMQAAPQTASAGAISQGRIFLNPIMKRDAKIIQARLKVLGYYTGEVDGAFGKNSKNALDYYATSQGLNSSAWSISLQRHLFAGSGQ